jgi:putative DNA primase/helicase
MDVSASLRSIGCLDPIPADGRIHRWKPEGMGKRNGWAVLHQVGTGIFGAAGDWSTGETITIRSGTVDHRAIEAVNKRVDKLSRINAIDAQLKAGLDWCAARPPCGSGIPGKDTYLARKKVYGPAMAGIRFDGNTVIIPMYDVDGGLHGVQTISPDGFKLFTKGCAKKGKMHRIPGKTFTVIAEGYATAASIHMATGFECIVAFDAGNLRPVAEAIRQKHPKAQIIIAADDDRETPGNPGLTKANEAAKAIKAKVAVPPEGGDWNDHHCKHGLTDLALKFYEYI